MSDETDQLEELRLLKARVASVAQEHNVELVSFAIVPANDPDENDMVSCYFKLSMEAVETEDQTVQRHTDGAFDEIFSSLDFDDDLLEEFASDEEKAKKEAEAAADAARITSIDDWLATIDDDE